MSKRDCTHALLSRAVADGESCSLSSTRRTVPSGCLSSRSSYRRIPASTRRFRYAASRGSASAPASMASAMASTSRNSSSSPASENRYGSPLRRVSRPPVAFGSSM